MADDMARRRRHLTMESIAALPPLRETIAAHGLDAKKRFGQHFLLDLNLTRRIARAAAARPAARSIEVGPGPGGLTRALLPEGATHASSPSSSTRAPSTPCASSRRAADSRLSLLEADALEVDLTRPRPGATAHRRQPALQRLDAAARALAA